jgi:hypothetical protein
MCAARVIHGNGELWSKAQFLVGEQVGASGAATAVLVSSMRKLSGGRARAAALVPRTRRRIWAPS